MNDRHDNQSFPPELEAIDRRLDGLARAEREAAPAALEARICAATAGSFAARGLVRTHEAAGARGGVLARLGGRRLDWPMRVAAVIAVMIGGWAVVHGIDGTPAKGPSLNAQFNPDEVFEYVFGRQGTTDQIQRLLLDTAQLEDLVGGNDLGDIDSSDQESL